MEMPCSSSTIHWIFFPKLYVLALGCSYIEPDLTSLFKSYDDVKIVKASPDSAVLPGERCREE